MSRVLNKYRNKPVKIDGIRFASIAEGRRYSELKLLERAKEIRALELQPSYPLSVNGHHICTYIADFRYFERGRTVVEDVKGFKTPEYEIKSKLFMALNPNVKFAEVKHGMTSWRAA